MRFTPNGQGGTLCPRQMCQMCPRLIFRCVQEMQTEPSKQVRLGYVSGVVPKAKAAPFERILFRATRGNMFLKQAPIEEPVVDPASGEKV